MAEQDKNVSPSVLWEVWKRILGFSKPYLVWLIAGLILTGLATGVWLSIPLGIRALNLFEINSASHLNRSMSHSFYARATQIKGVTVTWNDPVMTAI